MCQRPALVPRQGPAPGKLAQCPGGGHFRPNLAGCYPPALREGLNRHGEAELPKAPAHTQTSKTHSCVLVQMPQFQLSCMNTRTFHICGNRPERPATGRSSWMLREAEEHGPSVPSHLHRVMQSTRRSDGTDPGPSASGRSLFNT